MKEIVLRFQIENMSSSGQYGHRGEVFSLRMTDECERGLEKREPRALVIEGNYETASTSH